MPVSKPQAPKVFISYSWDSDKHKDDVLNLSNRLRSHGIDCSIDQYEISPPEGWQNWMRNQVEESNFVLVVCTEQYKRRFQGKEELGKGKGVTWEGTIINQLIYDRVINTQFIPITLSAQDDKYIPTELRRFTYYSLGNLNWETDKGYESLYRHLTNQPKTRKPDLGTFVPLSQRQRQQTVSPPKAEQEAQQEKLAKLYREARRWSKAGEWQKVISVFQQMEIQNLPFYDPKGFYQLARNQIFKEEAAEREIKNLYHEGANYFQAQDWNQAQKKFQAILQRNPRDRYLLAHTKEKLAQIEKKLENKKWLYIGLTTLIWLFCGFVINSLGLGTAGAIGGLLTGIVFALIFQGIKNNQSSKQELKSVQFIFAGFAIGLILGLLIGSLGNDISTLSDITPLLLAFLGIVTSIGAMRWQIS